MSWEEKNTWVGVVVIFGVLIYYSVSVLSRALGTGVDVATIHYQPTLLWAVGISIVVVILGAIVVAIMTGDPGTSDTRDKEINRFGEYVGSFVLTVAALAAMVTAMTEQPFFWIANILFLGFVLSNLTSGVVKLIAYRRGL